mmetsp:Transcript_24913/g.76850  ORF Transcript_24913/g.76850 Transcript_24913/m.76850 type:complete len:150 (+) Transcript_24913:154-603(+)
MLDAACLAAAASALREGGALTIASDNANYAALVSSLVDDRIFAAPPLTASAPGERYARLPSSIVHAGAPGPAVGWPAREVATGDSFFDRLWRRGASRHASRGDRFVVHLVRRAGAAPAVDVVEAPAVVEDASPQRPKKKRRRRGGKGSS